MCIRMYNCTIYIVYYKDMDNITIHRDIKARDGEAAMAQIGTTAQMDIERGLNGHHPPHTHIFIEYKHTQHTMCITRNTTRTFIISMSITSILGQKETVRP